jgi:murein L,D-transpeptidase YcbB/YkuD
VQALLKEGMHPSLHWGQFPDYQAKLELLYQPRAYEPLWSNAGKAIPQAKAAIESMAQAEAKGLNAIDYDVDLLRGWLRKLDAEAANPQDLASFDVALSVSLMRYASSLYMGRVNPRHVNFGLDIAPKQQDLPALLPKIAASDDPAPIFAGLEPKLQLYQYLLKALARYQLLLKDAPTAAINLPAKFKPGDRHADVPALRKLLTALGDVAGAEGGEASEAYDKILAEGVKRFQARHGLAADGVIGKSTLAQLNYPLSERLKQIQLGLERLRWLPEQIDGRYLMVNIPSFQLFGFHDGASAEQPDLEMNVIVGEAINGRNTPVFHSDMTYVNFRPYWNVPYKITVKEYLPILSRNPGYLASHNLEIVSNFAPNAAAHGASAGNIQMLSTGALKLRMKPGPKNALGLVKFAFPNTNNVYLHSTPSQGLFKRARRDFSHGCIRVEFPVTLAEFVLKDYPDWNRERIQAAMQRDKPSTMVLKTPIPVYIFYSTVLADAAGEAKFFNDIYGHDQILLEQLAKGFPYPP